MHQNSRPCTTDMATQKKIYKINGKEIASFSQERDLGILIQEDLEWDAYVAQVTNQANRIFGMIRRSHEDKSVKNIVQMYKYLVRPHLEYVLQTWRPHKEKHVDQIERVQRRATKMNRGLPSTPYETNLRRAREHPMRLVKNHVRLNTRIYFFSQRVISLGNSLPSVIVNSESVNDFKNRIGPLFEKQRTHCISKRGLFA